MYFFTFLTCYVSYSVPVHPFWKTIRIRIYSEPTISKKLVQHSYPYFAFSNTSVFISYSVPSFEFSSVPLIFRTRTLGSGCGKSTDPYPPFGVWGEHFVVSTFPKALSNFFLHAPSPIPKVCHKTPVLQSKEPSLSSLFSGFLAKYAKYQNLLYYSEFYEDTAKIWFYHMKPDYFNQFL